MSEHVIDIECDDVNTTAVFRAVCPCGYSSTEYPRKGDARRAGNAHARSFTGKRLAIWQTDPCPAWCVVEHADWHYTTEENPDHRRRHLSSRTMIERPTMKAVFRDGAWRQRRIAVRLKQWDPTVGTAAVWVEVAGERSEGGFATESDQDTAFMTLTATDALDIAEAIRQAACIALDKPVYGPEVTR